MGCGDQPKLAHRIFEEQVFCVVARNARMERGTFFHRVNGFMLVQCPADPETGKGGQHLLFARHRIPLFEDDCAIAVEQHPVFTVQLDGTGEHAAFRILPLRNQILDGIGMINDGHILCDDGAFI